MQKLYFLGFLHLFIRNILLKTVLRGTIYFSNLAKSSKVSIKLWKTKALPSAYPGLLSISFRQVKTGNTQFISISRTPAAISKTWQRQTQQASKLKHFAIRSNIPFRIYIGSSDELPSAGQSDSCRCNVLYVNQFDTGCPSGDLTKELQSSSTATAKRCHPVDMHTLHPTATAAIQQH